MFYFPCHFSHTHQEAINHRCGRLSDHVHAHEPVQRGLVVEVASGDQLGAELHAAFASAPLEGVLEHRADDLDVIVAGAVEAAEGLLDGAVVEAAQHEDELDEVLSDLRERRWNELKKIY